ncbi:MAG: type II toxin-antitoxin system VapC family toxin, partial [Chloroflexota bacterium]
EYVAVLSRPQQFSQPLAGAILANHVRWFERHYHVADKNAGVTALLLDLLQRVPTGGRQVHDANIVATMRCYGVQRLLTHNTDDFSRFAGFITVTPLVPNL